MLHKQKKGIHWLEFELFAEFPELVHGTFLRHGGVSQGAFSSLNVVESLGDNVALVQENRRRILEVLGLDQMVHVKQVHGIRVVGIDKAGEEADGLWTQERGKGLMIKHADCQAAIFYDPCRKGIANVHAGWRGNVQNMYAQTVQAMQCRLGSRPENLHVAISPSLGPCCGEFKNYQRELPENFWSFQVKPFYFDLWAIARMQLEACGVLPHHIQMAGRCTRCEHNEFFSHRKENPAGRLATVAALH